LEAAVSTLDLTTTRCTVRPSSRLRRMSQARTPPLIGDVLENEFAGAKGLCAVIELVEGRRGCVVAHI